MTLSSHTALLLVDVQQGLDEPRWGARNNPGAERNIAALLAAWRQAGRHVIHVQHMSQEPTSPLRPDHPGNAFKPEAAPQPHEAIVQKRVNSAFIGTTLEAQLRSHGIEHLVIAGITRRRVAGAFGPPVRRRCRAASRTFTWRMRASHSTPRCVRERSRCWRRRA